MSLPRETVGLIYLQMAYDGMPSAIAAKKRNKYSYEIAARGINLPSALTLNKN